MSHIKTIGPDFFIFQSFWCNAYALKIALVSLAYRAYVNKAKTSAFFIIQENPKVWHSLILGPRHTKAGRPKLGLKFEDCPPSCGLHFGCSCRIHEAWLH
jgi:hypothetical protein